MLNNRDEWDKVTLGDVAHEVAERLGSITAAYPIYGVDRSIGLTPAPKYVAENLKRYKRILPGMFAYNPMRLNIGSIGYCSSKHEPGYVSPDYVVFRCDTMRLDPEFLRYYIQSPSWRDWTAGSGVGSVRVRIYFRELAQMPIVIPPLAEQGAIAKILGALDDKIELNRHMKETLEAMSQVLFKAWFINFEPIPGFGPHKEWQATQLGNIPKGWQVVTFGDIATLHRKSIKPADFPDELFDHFSIPAFDDGQTPSHDLGSAIKSNKFILPDRCVMVSKLNPRFPRVWFLNSKRQRRSVASTEFLVLTAEPPCNNEYIYGLCRLVTGLETFRSLVTGTSSSHQRVKPDDLLSMKIVYPTSPHLFEFTKRISPIFDQIDSLNNQALTLIALRATLLPKLISGELRIKEAEQCIQEVTA